MEHVEDKKESHFNKCWRANFNLNKIYEYSEYLIKFTFLKRAIYSAMAGFFIGIAYLVYFICKASFGNITGPIVGSLTFPFAIFAILYMGGNLFTSNTLMVVSVIKKKFKLRNFIFQLLITWIFNFVGSLLAMGLSWLIIYNNVDYKVAAVTTSISKLNSPWFSILASAFLCNVLVCGCVYIYNTMESNVVKFLFVYLTIVLFAISGFQHSIANQYSITLGLTFFDDNQVMNIYNSTHSSKPFNESQAWGWGGFFLYNEPLVSLSNVMSGMFIPIIYMVSEYKPKSKKDKNKDFA